MKSVEEYDNASGEATWQHLHKYIAISDRACIIMGWCLLWMTFCILTWVAAQDLCILVAEDGQSRDQAPYEIPLVCLAYICGSAALATFATYLFKADRKLFQCVQVSDDDDYDYFSSLL